MWAMQELFTEPRFVAAVREFNAANFFEAHEVWEDLWNDLVGAPKQACQGLIQIAAGYHKLSIGNVLGARKLLERGVRTLVPLLPNSPWATQFAAAVTRDLKLLEAGRVQAPGDPPQLPVSLS
jgi:hypothetical protein